MPSSQYRGRNNTPAEALALERLLNQGFNSGNVADQLLWESGVDPQVVGTGRTDPDPTILTLPDERFEGRSKARSREAIIRGVPAFGLPKISTWAYCIVRPTRLASPLWSIKEEDDSREQGSLPGSNSVVLHGP